MKKILLFITITILLHPSISLAKAPKFVAGVVPHVYEFAKAKNPKGYYWCGHAVLKSVGKYVTGQDRTLSNINKTFSQNSRGFRNDNYCKEGSGKHWCASLQDIMWAAQKSQNGGYGKKNSVLRIKRRGDYKAFLDQIKGAVSANYPAIVPSDWKYPGAGHFWIIVGYREDKSGSAEEGWLYLRDVALTKPRHTKYDRIVKVKEFVDKTKHTGNSIHMFFMKR